MNEKDIFVEEIKKMNNKFKELCDQNNKLIIRINKAIMKRDIEYYLVQENISFKIENNSTYLILGHKNFEEINILDFGFDIRLKDIYINSSFDIELKDYTTFGDAFKIENEYVSISEDYFLNNDIYALDINTIKNLIEMFNERILELENNISYLQNHSDIKTYEYEYSLYNKIYAPEIFFKDINDIVSYINKNI